MRTAGRCYFVRHRKKNNAGSIRKERNGRFREETVNGWPKVHTTKGKSKERDLEKRQVCAKNPAVGHELRRWWRGRTTRRRPLIWYTSRVNKRNIKMFWHSRAQARGAPVRAPGRSRSDLLQRSAHVPELTQPTVQLTELAQPRSRARPVLSFSAPLSTAGSIKLVCVFRLLVRFTLPCVG